MRQQMKSLDALDIAKRARNSAKELTPYHFLKFRKKILRAEELPALLHKIEAYDGPSLTRLAIKLTALTFLRTNELLGARWSEFDMDAQQWHIPAERMKMRTPHIIPLSTQSIAILQQIYKLSGKQPLLFPCKQGNGKPINNNTIFYTLHLMGYRSPGYGFREIASTILAEQGYPDEHIKLQLGRHKRDVIPTSCNPALYLEQRTKMMQAWGDYLDRCKQPPNLYAN